MPRSYPPEFRRKVLDLVASGRKVAEVAQLLGISDQTIYVWRRQHVDPRLPLPRLLEAGPDVDVGADQDADRPQIP
ncbi:MULTISPECIES: transposase [unclassified Streptomyces]|nr:transposase [Streptomyces sp. S1A1-3]